jgi:tripartite-type tricarboxylate transporter receptor subunit TctC
MLRKTAALALALSLGAGGVNAADFYKDKTITIIASSSGTYEDYARQLSKHLGRHIPGSPNVITQVMAGASGLTAANYIYNAAPKDGTVFVVTHGHIPTLPMINPNGTRFDPTKFSWVGSVTKDVFVGYVWHTSPVQSMEEARTKEITIGGQAPGSMSIDMGILAKEMLGLKFNIITGYSGSDETKLAIQRGELNAQFGTAWSSLKRENGDWLRDKKIKVIVQFGFKPHPELKDVPLFVDLAKNEEDHKALELMLARQETAKPFYGPPDIPADRLAIIRKAFDEMVKDKDFLADMQKQSLDVEQPMGWEETSSLVARLQKTEPQVVKRLNSAFERFKETRK